MDSYHLLLLFGLRAIITLQLVLIMYKVPSIAQFSNTFLIAICMYTMLLNGQLKNMSDAGPIEQMFDEYDLELIENIRLEELYNADSQNGLDDCFLDEEDMRMFLTPPSVDMWNDVDPTKVPSKFHIDDAKKKNWELAKIEIKSMKQRIGQILKLDDCSTKPSTEEIFSKLIMKLFGAESSIGQFFRMELNLSEESWLSFMCVFCTQAAYRVSTLELYMNNSALKELLPMNQDDYMDIWNKMATEK